MRTLVLEQVKNVRDLGGIPVADGRTIKRGLMFRGAKLAGGTPQDYDMLFGVKGIKRVVDLRIGYERLAKPDPDIAGIENIHIPFYDNDLVGYEYFKPVPGTITIGKDFACDPDDFYRDMANPLTATQMGKALRVVFESAEAGTPVYFHCSNGKDRAGVLSLAALEVLGASEDAIMEDYLLTNVSRDKDVPDIYQRFLRLCQGDEDFAQRITQGHCARPENIGAFRQAVDAQYGSMSSFICEILGISDKDLSRLRHNLTE